MSTTFGCARVSTTEIADALKIGRSSVAITASAGGDPDSAMR
jgi:hypothetical protein